MSPARAACRLVVPAYNESARILRCLQSVLDSPLPPGCHWAEWAVLDDQSDDGTPGLVESWARRHPGIPLRVIHSGTRSGKAVNLGDYHRHLAASGRLTDLVAVIDADLAATTGAMGALIRPLIDDPGLGVTFGVDQMDGAAPRQWPAVFQKEVCAHLLRLEGLDRPRAYGRLFAYRVGVLSDFGWSAGTADDIQLARYLEAHRVRVRTAAEARVLVTPAGSLRDFYLQTYRDHANRARTGIPPEPLAHRIRATWRAARAHPLWASAYAGARIVAGVRHRSGPVRYSSAWEPPRSTKEAIDPVSP